MSSNYTINRDSCLYEHVRKDTGAIFYVGKGTGKRPYSAAHRNKHWHFIANKTDYYVRILFTSTEEELVLLAEQERIDQLKKLGVKLCNYTLGGEGTSGYKHSQESKLKIGVASKKFMLGKPMSLEIRNKISKAKTGVPLSVDTRLKISLGNTGKQMSEESKRKISLANTGKKRTQEAKLKMSLAKKRKGCYEQ